MEKLINKMKLTFYGNLNIKIKSTESIKLTNKLTK